jgi:hypothetical protein
MQFRALVLSLAGAAALAVPAVAFAATPLQDHLSAQNNSGETGTATLLQSGANVIVRLRLSGAPVEPQPAHIHKGTCDKLDPKPAYPLSNVVNGVSETVVKDVSLSDFTSGKYAINVHKSLKDIPTYVACGNITAPAAMAPGMKM